MTQPTGPFVRYLTLNCGGLSGDVYQELLLALEAMPDTQKPHIVAIQETHWREDSATEFSTGEWQVVSSHRNGYKAAGVLILIHRTLLKKRCLHTPSHIQAGFYIFVSLISHRPWIVLLPTKDR